MNKRSVQEYFDAHSHDHAYNSKPSDFKDITDYLRNRFNRPLRVLDVGCGNGSFIISLFQSGLQPVSFDGIETSEKMLALARKNLVSYNNVNLRLTNIFEFEPKEGYDVINMSYVLHHLIESTRGNSSKLAEKMIDRCKAMLKSGGVLVIKEMDYTSHITDGLTAWLVFYGLKFLNKTRIDLSRRIPWLQLGLEVNFFPKSALTIMIRRYFNNLEELRTTYVDIPRLYRYFLLRKLGTLVFIAYN